MAFTLETAILVSLVLSVGFFIGRRFYRRRPSESLLRTGFLSSLGLFLGLGFAWVIRFVMETNIPALYMQWYFRFTYGS